MRKSTETCEDRMDQWTHPFHTLNAQAKLSFTFGCKCFLPSVPSARSLLFSGPLLADSHEVLFGRLLPRYCRRQMNQRDQRASSRAMHKREDAEGRELRVNDLKGQSEGVAGRQVN